MRLKTAQQLLSCRQTRAKQIKTSHKTRINKKTALSYRNAKSKRAPKCKQMKQAAR